MVDDLKLVVVATARPSMEFDSASWTRERAVLELVFGLIASL
jgi:hypothetical protein